VYPLCHFHWDSESDVATAVLRTRFADFEDAGFFSEDTANGFRRNAPEVGQFLGLEVLFSHHEGAEVQWDGLDAPSAKLLGTAKDINVVYGARHFALLRY